MVLPVADVHWRYEPPDVGGGVVLDASRAPEVPGTITGTPAQAVPNAALPYRYGLTFAQATPDYVSAPLVFAGPTPPAYNLTPAGDFTLAIAGTAPPTFGTGGGSTGGNIAIGLGVTTGAAPELGAWLEISSAGALEFWIGDGAGAPSVVANPGRRKKGIAIIAVAN